MKTLRYFSLVIFLFLDRSVFCDIIPDNSHWVDKCVKITNIDEFNDTYFIGYVPLAFISFESYIINSSECLSKGYYLNLFEIWAISKENLSEQEVLLLDFPDEYGAVKSNIQIDPYEGYVHDSIPLDAIAEFYRILGFTWNSVVLYKWKDVYSFNNGNPDSVNYYEYNGDSTQLTDHVLNVENPVNSSEIVISPNPARNLLSIQISNNYVGTSHISIISGDGKLQDCFVFTKNNYNFFQDITMDNIPKGLYFIKFDFGNFIEVKRILIE